MTRKYDVVDADGHILEPANLWVSELDAKFKERAPQVLIDTDGKERSLAACRT